MPKVFVYGAQMVHPAAREKAWAGRVREHAVRFTAPGLPIFEPVFAALEPREGELAHGVILEFDEQSWTELVALERSYELREVEVELLDPADAEELGASLLRCPAFFITKAMREEGRPSARYARKLAAGARAHGLPPEVIARYEHASERGGRASLALAWLFPLASRIGLVPTAILVLGVLPLSIAAVLVWLLR